MSETLPDRISPEDMARATAVSDTLKSAISSFQAKQKELAAVRDEVTAADAVVSFVGKEMAAKYTLGEKDTVDAEGKIHRAPHA